MAEFIDAYRERTGPALGDKPVTRLTSLAFFVSPACGRALSPRGWRWLRATARFRGMGVRASPGRFDFPARSMAMASNRLGRW